MQWQHGTYQKLDDGSLVLTPIADDGRQLSSDPCNYDSSIYTKYNQPEVFKVRDSPSLGNQHAQELMRYDQKYEQLLDPYHSIQRLNLYRFDGSPIPVMYLAYRPPQMVPTRTLHPKATASAKTKRALEQIDGPRVWIDNQRLWCFALGVGTMGIGGVLLYLS